MIAGLIYSLCTLTALGCAVLLFRSYLRTRARLPLWSALCFVGLSLNNLLVVVDRIIFPTQYDLSIIRLIPALIGMALLIYGLIWEGE